MSQIAKQRIAQEKQNRTGRLDLSNCGLTDLETQVPELFELTHLGELVLSNEWFEWNEDEKMWEQKESQNKGEANKLDKLPEDMRRLTNLRVFICGGRERGLGITDLSPLSRLVNLTELYLHQNKITDLSPLSGLGTLTVLFLWQNQITDLSPLLGLGNLTRLVLNHNQITDLPPLSGLGKLTQLDLGWNQITDLSPLSGLGNLMQLHLRRNQITNLSPLSGLVNLTELYISDNQITNLTPLSGLVNLTELTLGRNKITDLTPLVPHYKRGIRINVDSNPLQTPPIEIVEQGSDAIKSYLEAYKQGKRPLNELKVLLVGEGAAGKTSLVKALRKMPFNKKESQTHGINISQMSVFTPNKQDITLHFGDFGGQEIMHATHQFFLSKRSLYILVLDSRRDEKAEYWLKHIESFGGNSPVLVVLNKIDENPTFSLNEDFLRKKYPNIKGFYKVSCQNQKGIDALYDAIGNLIDELEMCQTLFPKPWWEVKETFLNLQKDYINYDEYHNICTKSMVLSKNDQAVLLGFLNDLGIVLYYEKLSIHDTHVLNPHWLTNAVYRVINSPIVTETKGIFKEENLHTIITDSRYQPEAPNLLDNIMRFINNQPKLRSYQFPPDKYAFLVGMMQQFELCYEMTQKRGTYILPELLGVEEQTVMLSGKKVRFIVHYPEFLPNSILPRLMVSLHQYIYEDKRWRTGMVLHEPDIFKITANVVADKEEKRLYIDIAGERCQDFLTYIRKQLRSINQSFHTLKVEELIPLPDRNEQGEEVLVTYEELKGFQEMGDTYYSNGILRKRYKIQDLLEGVDGSKPKVLSVFISYAKEDLGHLQTLKNHLSPLVRNNDIEEPWHDREIQVGTDWDSTIQTKLNTADVVLILISVDYFSTPKNYIWEKEMPTIIKRHKNKQVLAIPIIVRDCTWEEDKWISALQAVTAINPTDNSRIPLTLAANQDTAFASAARQIKRAIEEYRTKR